MRIATKEQLENAALHYGLLPFFANRIKGFSIEEMAAPGVLFGNMRDDYGCWDWKGPVIREQTTAYGKFFNRKAGFVSMELLPDFINYRRKAYPVRPDSTEEMLLEIISSAEGMTSAELRRAVFGTPAKRAGYGDLVDITPNSAETTVRPKRQCFEAPLQKLQMGGHLLITDFQYKYSRKGERYGWGVALYSTPEIWFGRNFMLTDKSPEESFEILVSHVADKFPHADERSIRSLLK